MTFTAKGYPATLSLGQRVGVFAGMCVKPTFYPWDFSEGFGSYSKAFYLHLQKLGYVGTFVVYTLPDACSHVCVLVQIDRAKTLTVLNEHPRVK